jgi:hypothetical protein
MLLFFLLVKDRAAQQGTFFGQWGGSWSWSFFFLAIHMMKGNKCEEKRGDDEPIETDVIGNGRILQDKTIGEVHLPLRCSALHQHGRGTNINAP